MKSLVSFTCTSNTEENRHQSTGRRGKNWLCVSQGKAIPLIFEIAQEFWP